MNIRTMGLGSTGVAAHEDGRSATLDDGPQPGSLSARDDGTWRFTGLETPIFADPSGHRAQLMSVMGVGVVLATVAALLIVVTGAIGFANVPPALPLVTARAGHSLTVAAHRPRSHAVAVAYRQPRPHELRADLRADRQAHRDFQ
jgi:hypothetical protein